MEAVKEIQRLRQSANSIYSLFLQNIPQWKNRPTHYDKTGWGFNIDSRFSCTNKAVYVSFDSYMGTYGNSGCTSQCTIDDDLFQKHLIDYLNEHKEEVMFWVAKSIERRALLLKEKAEAELRVQIEALKELEKPV